MNKIILLRKKITTIMTEREFIFSGCENNPSEYHLKDGKTIYGVIIKLNISDGLEYHFVTSADLKEFKRYLDAKDRKSMKRFSTPFDIATILTAKKLEPSEAKH